MSTRDMLHYLNTHYEEDIQARIAKYLILHEQNLLQLSIVQVAQKCFTSPASVSRAARNFGFHNFDEMKHDIHQSVNISNPRFTLRLGPDDLKQLSNDAPAFYQDFAQQIAATILDTAQTISTEKIDELIKQIFQTDQAAFFGYDIMLDGVKVLQNAFLNDGLLTRVGETAKDQLALARQLKAGDVAVVFSSFGNFFSMVPDVYHAIVDSPAKTILVTQMASTQFTASFDQTYHISSKLNAEAGSYAMNFLLEYMARRAYVLSRK